jgi:site-specific recombinase XerD
MGHAHLETTGTYVHLSDDKLREEIEANLGYVPPGHAPNVE